MVTASLSTHIEPRTPQGGFANEPFVDFKNPENIREMQAALDHVASQLGREYDLIIGGRRLRTEGKIRSLNPARPAQVVGVHQKAGAEHAEEAMTAALSAFETWSRTSTSQRVSLLLDAAAIIRSRHFEFCAWLTYEVGKNWAEADADVGETIDFLEFYAREALRLSSATTPIQYPGERNQLLYIPLGVGAVIPPWNFPFAIMAGMTAASIVTGNTVVLKPSSDSPTIAAKFVEVLEGAGIPPGVVNFCPGSGATFGNAIVEHPKTRFIAFTGPNLLGWTFTSVLLAPRRDRSGSSGRFWKWAARTQSSFVPMLIWTRPWMALLQRLLDSVDRNVQHVHAQLLRLRCTTCLSSAFGKRWQSSLSEIRPPITIWAR